MSADAPYNGAVADPSEIHGVPGRMPPGAAQTLHRLGIGRFRASTAMRADGTTLRAWNAAVWAVLAALVSLSVARGTSGTP
jgi:hypothetical protein